MLHTVVLCLNKGDAVCIVVNTLRVLCNVLHTGSVVCSVLHTRCVVFYIHGGCLFLLSYIQGVYCVVC